VKQASNNMNLTMNHQQEETHQEEPNGGPKGSQSPIANRQSPIANSKVRVEFCDPAPLRLHPLHKHLPGPDVASTEWHAFVDAASAAGAEGLPAIVVTPEGLIMDGERRWRAAVQLQWKEIAYITRPEWEAAALIVDSLMGQRCLTKGAKVFLSLPLMAEYSKAAETRRLAWLQKGVKILQKPNVSPFPHSVRERHGWGRSEDLAEQLGTSARLVEQAVQIRKFFELPALREHKFTFQDGSEKTLREHFEPLILCGENPIGLGDVLKGIGYFVDPEGKPLAHPPPARNTHFFYFEHGWQGWAKQCGRWEVMDEADRGRAAEVIATAAREVPAEVLKAAVKAFKAEQKRRGKAQKRKEGKT
jgi:hypothetical protein